ncbi:uncharacterized protein V6R79_012372 [Siganus canaliculatus]
MDDLQAIMEEMRQLKAANEQLREQLKELDQSQVPGPSTAPPTVTPAGDLINDVPNVRYVYVPRERKCPKFTGKLSVDLLTIEKWVEEVVDSFEASSNAVTVRPSDEIAEIKECLRKQQAQLDAIMKHVTVQVPQSTQSQGDVFNSAKPLRFQANGKPICLRCNKPGHIARFCRVNLGPKAPVRSHSEVDVYSQVVGGGPDSRLSGN